LSLEKLSIYLMPSLHFLSKFKILRKICRVGIEPIRTTALYGIPPLSAPFTFLAQDSPQAPFFRHSFTLLSKDGFHDNDSLSSEEFSLSPLSCPEFPSGRPLHLCPRPEVPSFPFSSPFRTSRGALPKSIKEWSAQMRFLTLSPLPHRSLR